MSKRQKSIFIWNRSRTLEQIVWKTLQLRIRKLHHFLELAARKPEQDVEYVHQMRVWSRRTVAACQLFEDILPAKECDWFEHRMKQVRKAADRARNCDVMIIHFEQTPSSTLRNSVLKMTQSSRLNAQNSIQKVYEQLVLTNELTEHSNSIKQYLQRKKRTTSLTRKKCQTWARTQLLPFIRKFDQATAADLTDATNLHQLRIRGKQLRYAFELVAPAFPQKHNKKRSRLFKQLQNRLGELNDHQTAATSFQKWAEQCEKPRIAFYLLSLQSEELYQLDDKRQQFLKEWPRKRLNKLTKRFNQLIE